MTPVISEANRIRLAKTANNLNELCDPVRVKLLPNGIQASYQGRKLMFYYSKMVYHDNKADCKENTYRKFQRGREEKIIKMIFNIAEPAPRAPVEVIDVDGVTKCIEHVKAKVERLKALNRPTDSAVLAMLRNLLVEFEQYRIV